MELFTYFGLIIATFAGITCLTAFLGWISGDDDHMLRWLMTCLIYAITTTLLIIELIK